MELQQLNIVPNIDEKKIESTIDYNCRRKIILVINHNSQKEFEHESKNGYTGFRDESEGEGKRNYIGQINTVVVFEIMTNS